MKIVRRYELPRKKAAIFSILAVIVSIFLFSIFLKYDNIGITEGYRRLITYGFSPYKELGLTIRRTVPLLLLTLAVIIPRKAGIWNIGGQGQFYMGSIAAVGISLFVFPSQPPHILIPLTIVAAGAAGIGWALIAGFLRGKYGTNEIIVTILLNFVAGLLIQHLLVQGSWTGPTGVPQSASVPQSAVFPTIGGTVIPYHIFLVIGIAIFVKYFLEKTRRGYEIRATGDNPEATKLHGMSFMTSVLTVMLIGGALAGIAGYHQSVFVLKRLSAQPAALPATWGFFGVIFALLSRTNIIMSIFVSFFLSGILVGTDTLEISLGMTSGSDIVLLGILFASLVAFQFFNKFKISFNEG